MKKPTYAQLVALVEYLSVPAEYENLPLLDEPKAAIEYCIKNRQSHVFSDSTEFDAEEQLDISSKQNLEGYPTIIFFKKGEVIFKQLGALDKEGLLQLVNKYK